MRRAAPALVLLIVASSAMAASSPADLQRRVAQLLGEIRAEAGSPTKANDVARLRLELNALKTENSDAKDDRVAATLQEAEDDLSLVDAGQPLPPPKPGNIPPEDLPDRDAVASPASAPPLRSPALQKAASAADAATGVFDGSVAHGPVSPSAGAVAVPLKVPPTVKPAPMTAELDGYLDLKDYDSRVKLIQDACADLLAKKGVIDADGFGFNRLAWNLALKLEEHPRRGDFTSVKLVIDDDHTIHLVYDTDDDAGVDEVIDRAENLMAAPKKPIKPKRGRRKGRKGRGGGGGGGDDDSGGGSKHHKKGHGGGGGGGDDGGGDGGDGGDGGGGGGGGHAKVPHVKGGGADGSAFDGGDGGGSGDVAGPAGHRGRGGRGRHGGSSASGDEGGDGGGDGGGNGGGSGGRSGGVVGAGHSGHARAGGSVSSGEAGDDGGAGGERKGAKVPLPKDFTTRGGPPGLSEPGGGDGGGMPHFKPKTYDKNAAPVPDSASRPGAVSSPSGNTLASAGGAPGAASDAPLKAPIVSADEDLHDAVAAHAAESPRLSLPQPGSGADAPADSEGSSFPWAAASAAAGIGLFLGAHLMRRRAEKQARDAKTSTLS